ncbi:hypothetical protein AE177_14500 [Listeria monocytogenes]|uniref:Uncharacterized protein n=1 Tax=Listeria monocytogenes TaxID=1639 RepID=A0A823K4P9_LISMN|nr:hypothetical protein [Listeria monocytogenes]EHC6211632.1 hypothetical protein [Listeria monocytogenes serotype 1/2b]EAA0055466.1 hypothetical protein [Listeria monocytogenes]EAA0076207.1 hypothetical protein [Listeria monocytogenes]EAC2922791.1 hypothetical protein [Listeria monocytogenes]EAC3010998.1 hypothetical protein [Listeria monocytogenes]
MTKYKSLLKKWWFWLLIILLIAISSFLLWYTQSYNSEWGKGLSKEDKEVLEKANKSTNEFNKFAKEANSGIKSFNNDVTIDPQIVINPFTKMGDNITERSDEFIKDYDEYSISIQNILKDDYNNIKKLRDDVVAQQEEIKSIYSNAHNYNRELSTVESKIVENIYQEMHKEQKESLGLKNHEFNKNAEFSDKAIKLMSGVD